MTAPRSFGEGGKLGKGGWFSLPPLRKASERVILSAAGAKDLLAHRCEGPADGKDPQARRPCFRCRRRETAGPSLARCLRGKRTGEGCLPLSPFTKRASLSS